MTTKLAPIVPDIDDDADDTVLEHASSAVVPDGWELLPAGETREIHVVAASLSRAHERPFQIILRRDLNVPFRYGFEIKVLGETRLVRDATKAYCGRVGAAWIETEAAILVRVRA
jgi:hypothetical protein